MALDHFERHSSDENHISWSLNVLFHNEEDIVRMADEYAPLLDHPGLYDPTDPKWFHSTILKIGSVEDFSEEEVFKIADHLAPKLAKLSLPAFMFDSWWQWGSGNIVLHISPQDQYIPIYEAAESSVEAVLGKERATKAPFGRFIPHVALAYTKTHHDELIIGQQLSSKLIKPATFHVKSVSLVRQHPTNGHYEWDIARDIPIGQLLDN